MKIIKSPWFFLFFLTFLLFAPVTQARAESSRYFVKTTKSFWKNALGVRHSFDNGFTTDLSDFQVRLTRVFGLEIETVKALQILPVSDLAQTGSKIPTAKSLRDQKGKARLTPSEQITWGLKTIYDNSDLTATSGGEDVKVAVLDTGVDVSHPDLRSRITACKDFSHPKSPVVNDKCEDRNGHGTHVAGIIAADAGSDLLGIFGVAPGAGIFAYKTCDLNGSCLADDVAVAIRLAADEGAQVINMSFGSDKDISLVSDAVSYAYSKGVLLVAAAGNDGPFPDSIDYPAAYNKVIAVGAISQSQTVPDWSSRGINSQTKPGVIEDRDLEFAAPGENIESTWNKGNYVILSGTSMAAPFVSGLAAKLWQSEEKEPALATRGLLGLLAKDIASLGEDNLSGYGLPQLK